MGQESELITELKKRHARPDLYDTIYMTFDEYEEIISNNGDEIPINEEELFNKPALKDFAIYDRESKFYSLFREPADKSKVYQVGDALEKPIIEMSTRLENTTEPQNIYLFCQNINNGSYGTIELKTLRSDKDGYLPKVLIAFYLLIQALLYNRPEIFKRTMEPMAFDMSTSGNSHQAKGRKRVVKMVKVLRIDQGKVEKLVKAHREIMCPCWGVIGHWRQYKSGKRVWIEPYRKGKQRKDPNAYSAKEYRMV